ncbi:MarR family transcriptional regulator [Paenibacillus athensensis]|uniref:HTH marR-type domain-containing protein n=1 Tax=Paenibacillus athensensis TaxID=1967502 RepID=A0A4Y8PTR5_9BACL|nr:helix-turn-helix domain-containing protein [Paenibacillus athensensis]MCD1261641.1 MarR family transcriptional regulator [Paenibacillus athensensis]
MRTEDAKKIREAIGRLHRFFHTLSRGVDQHDGTSSITIAQVAVLRAVHHHPGLTMKELKERMGLAHSTISGIVDRLELKQLIERRVDANDKRFTRLYVNPEVQSYMMHQRVQLIDKSLSTYVEAASDQELEEIHRALQTLERLFLANSDKEDA